MANYSQPASSSTSEPLLPLPPSITLPRPSAGSSHRSSSSSSRKRPHSETNTGRSEHFAYSVKERIKSRYERCWLCMARPVEACHVISKKDNTFPRLRADGLVCFQELGDEDNAIGLCPTCHRNYDDLPEPGFVFLPDLKYLIRCEKADQARRRKAHRDHGISLSRIVPTAERYRLEQEQEGVVNADATGGQYRRYILHDFLPPGLHQQLHNSTREWDGSPTAALQNVMRIVGRSPKGLPPQIREQLGELLRLYDRDMSQDSAENVSSRAESPPSGESQESGNDREIFRASGSRDDGPSHETSVVDDNHESSRSGRDGKRTAGSKRTRAMNDLQHGIAQPAGKRRLLGRESVIRSSPPPLPPPPPAGEVLPDSLPDLINSVDDQHSQGSGPDTNTGMPDRRVGQKTQVSHTWGPFGTSNGAIDFATSINGYAE